ncbi:EVE domain-containing protein [Curvibacter sp. CHRR-16]|uniref:EVE domain-containing protein n=1 Tax=Curvibacter sp. CHRR-16 TaxID=2835872 RepID=UPI001BD96EB4|nr:EVE domain-containing protein [Curvibacter sp. CHRR-16]MBT0569338.1 EVE domain-containing protein [Curvibacter sp. CHRR-16]
MTQRPPHNWIAVACAEHARRGCRNPEHGFMQVCHGKAAPLRRIHPGDRVVYYSPTLTMGGKDRWQRFVSVGVVRSAVPYAFDMGGGFVPWRHDVHYLPAQEAAIAPLLPELEWAADGAWGAKLRFGLLHISDHDMRLIAAAMQVRWDALLHACVAPKMPPCAVQTDFFS